MSITHERLGFALLFRFLLIREKTNFNNFYDFVLFAFVVDPNFMRILEILRYAYDG